MICLSNFMQPSMITYTNETKISTFNSFWFALGSQHSKCQRLCRGKTKPGPVHDVPVQKSLIYRLTATFERCEIRWRRFTCLLRPVRTCLSFWGKGSYLSNSTNGKKWNLKKLKTKETPFNIENCVWKSIERVALSFIVELHTASFTISDTRRWIVLFFGLCNTLLWLWTTYGNRNNDCWKR